MQSFVDRNELIICVNHRQLMGVLVIRAHSYNHVVVAGLYVEVCVCVSFCTSDVILLCVLCVCVYVCVCVFCVNMCACRGVCVILTHVCRPCCPQPRQQHAISFIYLRKWKGPWLSIIPTSSHRVWRDKEMPHRIWRIVELDPTYGERSYPS